VIHCNPFIILIVLTWVDFYEVTGVRALFFLTVSMGEVPLEAGRRAKLPCRYIAEKTSPRALELNKSPSSFLWYTNYYVLQTALT
jgi:hypothetical protein